jgi:hypothetical protein
MPMMLLLMQMLLLLQMLLLMQTVPTRMWWQVGPAAGGVLAGRQCRQSPRGS